MSGVLGVVADVGAQVLVPGIGAAVGGYIAAQRAVRREVSRLVRVGVMRLVKREALRDGAGIDADVAEVMRRG